MIRHIVLIKSNQMVEVAMALNMVQSLVGKVPGLISIEIGSDFSDRCKGFTKLFIMNFKNIESLNGWANHEEHIPIRNILMSVAEMIVFDYNVEYNDKG